MSRLAPNPTEDADLTLDEVASVRGTCEPHRRRIRIGEKAMCPYTPELFERVALRSPALIERQSAVLDILRRSSVKVPTYRDPVKDHARVLALSHAIETLTSSRRSAACVPRNYVRAVRNHELRGDNAADAKFAALLDDLTVEQWEQFHDAVIGERTPSSLTVCYLCGPEPRNDFDVLVRLGIHPHNIWAFEADATLFDAAVSATRIADFRMLKIVRGSVDQFFANTPKRFDIIYLDACGPLPSAAQNTLRMVACALRHHRLASPGVLITNFSAPAEIREHAQLVAASLYPRHFLEYQHDDGSSGAAEGPVFSGLDFDEFRSQVTASFNDYYGQYITRQLFDLGCLIIPWVRMIESPQWPRFFKEDPKTVSALGVVMGQLEATDSQLSGLSVTESGYYATQFALRAQALIQPTTGTPSKLAKTWLQQMQGLPALSGKLDAATAILCHDVLSSTARFYTDTFAAALETFAARDKIFQFCDVPTESLAFGLLVSQFAYPLHYVTEAVRRWTYVAKTTRMFLDVIVFDEARYIYDWMPMAELLECGVLDDAQQLSYRFALDGLVKNRRWYNAEIFHGAAIVDQFADGFNAKYLRLREEVVAGTTVKRPRIAWPDRLFSQRAGVDTAGVANASVSATTDVSRREASWLSVAALDLETLNDTLVRFDIIVIQVFRSDIEQCSCRPIQAVLECLAVSATVACNAMGKIDFVVDGYNDDSRALFEIPEFQKWVSATLEAVPHLIFFLCMSERAQGIQAILGCVCRAEAVAPDAIVLKGDYEVLHAFLKRSFQGLNAFTEAFSLNDEVNYQVSTAFTKCVTHFLGGG